MKTIRFALGSFVFIAVFASASMAQLQRTFVSGFGSDSNVCSHAAPCRTFGQAISQTNAGGEVYVLDTAGYGPFTITKTISVVAQGVTAGISVFSGHGIHKRRRHGHHHPARVDHQQPGQQRARHRFQHGGNALHRRLRGQRLLQWYWNRFPGGGQA